MSENESITPIERNVPQRFGAFTPPTLELEAQGAEAHFSLATFWHVVIKRLPTIITATIIVAVLTALYFRR